MPPDITIARKRCQDVLVAKILAPRLVLLRRLADLPAEKRQCLTEAVRLRSTAFCEYPRNHRAIAECMLQYTPGS